MLWIFFYKFTKIKSALIPRQQPTALFSIYQSNSWTIRHLVEEMINPATQHIILKIVGCCSVHRMQYNPALSQYFAGCPLFYHTVNEIIILVNQMIDSTTLLALLSCFFGRTKSQYTSFIINVNPLFVMVIFIV